MWESLELLFNGYITIMIFRWLKVESIILHEILWSLSSYYSFIQYFTKSIGFFCQNNNDQNLHFPVTFLKKKQKYFCDCIMIKHPTRQQKRSRDRSNEMLALKFLWIKLKRLTYETFLVIEGNHASDERNCLSPTTVVE